MKIFIFYIFLLVTLNAISVHHHADGPMGIPMGGPMGGTMGEPTGNHVPSGHHAAGPAGFIRLHRFNE